MTHALAIDRLAAWVGSPSTEGLPTQVDPRFAYYRVLQRRNLFKALRELHPAVRVAAEAWRPGTWERLVEGYCRERHPDHFDPNRFGEGLADFLLARGSSPDLPAYLAELADFAVCRRRAATAADDSGEDLERRIFVRCYTHDVPDYVGRVVEGLPCEVPTPTPTRVIVYRSWRSDEVRLYFPTDATLLCLAWHAGLGPRPPHADALAERLVADGLLPPGR
jgi:hypothetical protein